MSGELASAHTLYITDTEGSLPRLRAQLIAAGIRVRDMHDGLFDIDSGPDNAFLRETTFVFGGDAIKDAAHSDDVYVVLNRLEQLGARVVRLVGNRDANVLLPLLQLPLLEFYLYSELSYWATGENNHILMSDMTPQAVSELYAHFSKVVLLLPAYRQALKAKEGNAFLKALAPDVQTSLVRITDTNLRHKYEYAYENDTLACYLMHVDPGRMSFLEYLLTEPDHVGLLEACGMHSDMTPSDRLNVLPTLLDILSPETTRFYLNQDDCDQMTHLQRLINAAYFHWSTQNQQGEPDYFKGKSKDEIISMSFDRLKKSLPGGLYFNYLTAADGTFQQGDVLMTHAKTENPSAVEYANQLQARFKKAYADNAWSDFTRVMQAMVLQGLPTSVRKALPAPYCLSTNCEQIRGANGVPSMPTLSPITIVGHATHAPGTDRLPLAMTSYANGHVLFTLDPTYSGKCVMSLQQHQLGMGNLLMLVMHDGEKATCTQAMLLQANQCIALPHPESLSVTNAWLNTVTLSEQVEAGREDAYKKLEAFSFQALPDEFKTAEIWGEGNIPSQSKATLGAHVYKSAAGEYHLTTYDEFASRQSLALSEEVKDKLIALREKDCRPESSARPRP